MTTAGARLTRAEAFPYDKIRYAGARTGKQSDAPSWKGERGATEIAANSNADWLSPLQIRSFSPRRRVTAAASATHRDARVERGPAKLASFASVRASQTAIHAHGVEGFGEEARARGIVFV